MGTDSITGYSMINAESLEAAEKIASAKSVHQEHPSLRGDVTRSAAPGDVTRSGSLGDVAHAFQGKHHPVRGEIGAEFFRLNHQLCVLRHLVRV